MQYDIVMLGHVSRDVLVDCHGREERLLGGAVVQSSFAAVRSGASVLVVTKVAPADRESLAFLEKEGIALRVGESPATTSIRNVFRTEDRERRDTFLVSRAASFAPDDLPGDVGARVIDLAGLFEGELPDTLIGAFADRGNIAVDAQGLLRRAEPDGRMAYADWAGKKRWLPLVSFFKTDAAEAEILTGTDDRERAARLLHEWGAREVMVTHGTEVIVVADEGLFRAPLTPANLSGRTGRGDTAFASYMARRLDHGIGESTRYCAALCSLKMEHPGPFRGTVGEVIERMERDHNSR